MDIIEDSDYWKKYNKNLLKLSNELISFNKKNSFNFIEANSYNHIRDIVVLTILNEYSKNSCVSVLDYGSNLVPWSNISNKFNQKRIDLTIFDPFSEYDYSKNCDLGFSVKIVDKVQNIHPNEFNITLFGSSSQYINNFYEQTLTNKSILANKILFTHTPLSISSEFISKQFTGFKGHKYIRSYDDLVSHLKKIGYELIFKSLLPNEIGCVEEIFSSKTISVNLLFEKTF